MKLQTSKSCRHQNLSVISSVLEKSGGAEVIRFAHSQGAGLLSWSARANRATHKIYLGLPIRWLDDLGETLRVERAAQWLAIAVRRATR
jgi:hypothetical protein